MPGGNSVAPLLRPSTMESLGGFINGSVVFFLQESFSLSGECMVMAVQLPSPAQWVSVSHKPQQLLDAHHCFPSFELQVYKMIPSFWKRQTPSHRSINNFSVYRYWEEINFLNPWAKILLNAHQSQNLTDYMCFSFPNPVCFSPPGPWNMPFYLLGISLSFPSPAKLLLSLSYIPQAALSNYLFHEDKTSCHVFPHNPGGYGVMAYLYVFSLILWVLSCLEVLSFESIQPSGRYKESPVGDRTTLEHIFSQKSVESPGNKFSKDDYDLSRRLAWACSTNRSQICEKRTDNLSEGT